jgi:PPE-repeat protein
MLERGATSGAAYERWLKQQDESAEAAEARARAAAKADAEAAAWRQRRYLLQNMNGGAMPGDRRAALFSHPSFRASLHRR